MVSELWKCQFMWLFLYVCVEELNTLSSVKLLWVWKARGRWFYVGFMNIYKEMPPHTLCTGHKEAFSFHHIQIFLVLLFIGIKVSIYIYITAGRTKFQDKWSVFQLEHKREPLWCKPGVPPRPEAVHAFSLFLLFPLLCLSLSPTPLPSPFSFTSPALPPCFPLPCPPLSPLFSLFPSFPFWYWGLNIGFHTCFTNTLLESYILRLLLLKSLTFLVFYLD